MGRFLFARSSSGCEGIRLTIIQPRRGGDMIAQHAAAGGRHGGFVLQVYGYWDMVAAFVRHSTLDAALVYDTCQEMYFQYAKIQPHLAGFRDKMNLPEWMRNLERLVEGSKAGRMRLATMQKNLAAMASARSGQASAPADRVKAQGRVGRRRHK